MKAIKTNPLEDKKWQKKFEQAFKKDIRKNQKNPPSQIISEIVCTQEDIGEPNYFPKTKKTRK